MKKILAVLLAVLMVASLFAGCASEKPATTTGENTTAPATPDESKAPEQTDAPEEIVNLKWVTVGSGMPANYDAWKAHINEYLGEKIGVNIDIEVIGWGDWDTRRNMIVSTNEPYDIMFTNSGTYFNDVNIGAFADLSDIIETAAPELYKYIPADYWDACRIDGKLYAVPTYKDSSHSQYFVYDKALVEEVYPDYVNAHDLDAVSPVLEAMYNKTGNPPMVVSKEGLNSLGALLYDGFSSGLDVIGVSYDADPAAPKVVVTLEQEDFLHDLEVVHSWYENGWINSDAAILDEAPQYKGFFAAQGWPSAAKTSWKMGDVEAVAVQWDRTVLSNGTVQGSLNCISAACKYPEKALQLLELVNTDPIVRDALFYGLEGDNFDYVDAFGEKRVHKNNSDWTMAGYTQGTFFAVTPTDEMEENQWDEVKALNEGAHPSPILGFCFNTEPVVDQLAACTAIYKEYKATIVTGTDISCIPGMLDAMYESGLQEIIDEAQRQLDLWVASK